VNNGLNSVYRATLDTYAAYSGIDWRYPFYDRRIIDFMLSLPPRLSFRDGYSRCILRQSMKGMLPEPVRRRITKAHGGDLQALGMKERETSRVCSLINNSRAVQIGLVDPARLSRAWEVFRDTEKVPARPLVRYLCAEAWLRHYEKILADQTGP
jgi:asparagine synthase (glutamine-hydrolysing)